MISSDKFPTVSVVLPFRNNEATLEKALKSIIDHDYPKDKFEIILVCDDSEDDSIPIAKAFQQSHASKVRLIIDQNPAKGPARAANQGFQVASGDIVARMDGDALVPKNWLSGIARLFSEKEVAAVQPFRHRDRR